MTYVSVHYTVCNQNQKMLVIFAKLKTSFHNVNLKLCLDIVWILFFFFFCHINILLQTILQVKTLKQTGFGTRLCE